MPTAPTTPIKIYSFDSFGAVAGSGTSDSVARANMTAINDAIAWSATSGQTVYGLGGTYRVLPPTTGLSYLNLVSGASVECFTGCIIRRSYDVSGNKAVLHNDQTSPIENASWTGGIFETTIDPETGTFYSGNVIKISGTDVKLTDVEVKGYGAGRAMALNGNRIVVIRPLIRNANPDDAGGIRFTGGDGFRCWGGYVESGGDAALQFSCAPGNGPITDGAYIGTTGKSSTGRLLLVGTSYDAIRHVRFEGVSGVGGAGGNAIKVQNLTRISGVNTPISDVVFRDVDITSPSSGATQESVVVLNELPEAGMVSNINFENLVIRNPNGTPFLVKAGEIGSKIDGLRWRGGGVFPTKAGFPALSLSFLSNALFDSIELGSGTDQNIVVIGATATCENVVFSDVVLRNVPAGRQGVQFNLAKNCGWTRGAMIGASTAKAAFFSSSALNCYVDQADLTGIGTEPKIDLTSVASQRLSNNYGSLQSLGPVPLGMKVPVTLSGGAVVAISSNIAIGPTGALDTINGGKEGDLLVVTAQNGQTITVSDSPGLKLQGTCVLNSQLDTLTLLKRTTDWLEIGRSDNA